jgi:hypothetical protein
VKECIVCQTDAHHMTHDARLKFSGSICDRKILALKITTQSKITSFF